MNFDIFLVFNSTAIDTISGKIPESNPKHEPKNELKEEPRTESEEKGEITQDPNSPVYLEFGSYIVLILEKTSFNKGTGIIITANFLITAAVIFEDSVEHYVFKTHLALGRQKHTILRDYPNRPLTMAFVSCFTLNSCYPQMTKNQYLLRKLFACAIKNLVL